MSGLANKDQAVFRINRSGLILEIWGERKTDPEKIIGRYYFYNALDYCDVRIFFSLMALVLRTGYEQAMPATIFYQQKIISRSIKMRKYGNDIMLIMTRSQSTN